MVAKPELPIRVTGDTGPFKRDLRGAERYAEGFGSRMATNGRMLRGWTVALSAAGLATAAVAKKTLDYADSIDKAARAANIGAERLQTLRYAAEQSGIATGKMDGALSKFNITLGRVMSGMETASSSVSQAFEQLGLSADELQKSGLNTEQVLDVVLARLADVKDGSEQAAIAAQLFGKSAGPQLRNLLAAGVEGMVALEEAAREAGNVIDEALITRGVEIADKWNEIMSSMARSTYQFALQAATAMDNAFGFTDSGKSEMLRGQIDDLAKERENYVAQLDSEKDRFARSAVGGGGLETGMLGDLVEATESELNILNQQLLDLDIAKSERERRLSELAGGIDPIEGGGLPGAGSSSGGGGGGSLGTTERDLEVMSERWSTKLEMLQEFQAQELQILADARAQNLISEEEYQEKLTKLNQEHADKRAEVSRLEAAARINTVLGAGEDILGAMGAFNEKALRAARVFGAAQALISTYEGSAKALAGPFPGNIAAAAAVAAKGLALVGAIKSVNSSGGGTGGGTGGGGATSALNSYAAPQPVERRVAEFQFVGGNVLDPRAIVDAMNDAYDQGYQIKGVLS